jgi:hypothetical protein
MIDPVKTPEAKNKVGCSGPPLLFPMTSAGVRLAKRIRSFRVELESRASPDSAGTVSTLSGTCLERDDLRVVRQRSCRHGPGHHAIAIPPAAMGRSGGALVNWTP